jgi:hypothetical protein
MEYGASMALHPLLEADAVDVQRIRQQLHLARSARTPATSEDYPSASHAELRPHLYPYLLALLDARWGDASQLEPTAALIDATLPAGSAAAFLPTSLRALGAALAGEPETAMRLLEEAPRGQWYEFGRWSAFFGRCHDRWLMAGILEGLGRPREALRWYEAATHMSPLDVALLAPSALRGAQLRGRLGDAEAEAAELARFAQLWRYADPELRACLDSGTVAGASRRRDGALECRDWLAR